MVLVPGRDNPVSAAFSGVITHGAGCVAFGLTLGDCLLSLVAVYKMYKKSKPIFALFFIFGGAQSAAMASNARLIVTGSHYSPTCVMLSAHPNRIYVG